MSGVEKYMSKIGLKGKPKKKKKEIKIYARRGSQEEPDTPFLSIHKFLCKQKIMNNN